MRKRFQVSSALHKVDVIFYNIQTSPHTSSTHVARMSHWNVESRKEHATVGAYIARLWIVEQRKWIARPKPVLNYVKLDKKSTSRALWLQCAHVIRCISYIYRHTHERTTYVHMIHGGAHGIVHDKHERKKKKITNQQHGEGWAKHQRYYVTVVIFFFFGKTEALSQHTRDRLDGRTCVRRNDRDENYVLCTWKMKRTNEW